MEKMLQGTVVAVGPGVTDKVVYLLHNLALLTIFKTRSY